MLKIDHISLSETMDYWIWKSFACKKKILKKKRGRRRKKIWFKVMTKDKMTCFRWGYTVIRPRKQRGKNTQVQRQSPYKVLGKVPLSYALLLVECFKQSDSPLGVIFFDWRDCILSMSMRNLVSNKVYVCTSADMRSCTWTVLEALAV